MVDRNGECDSGWSQRPRNRRAAGVARDVPLERGAVIAEAGEPSPYRVFPYSRRAVARRQHSGGATVEVAVVGNEGVASVSAALGGDWLPFRIVTQVPGRAIRIPTDVVSSLIGECGELHERLLAYTHQMIAQVAQSAVCNRFHNAKQRLARWLLMTADRAGTNELPLTHEFISYMVGGPAERGHRSGGRAARSRERSTTGAG